MKHTAHIIIACALALTACKKEDKRVTYTVTTEASSLQYREGDRWVNHQHRVGPILHASILGIDSVMLDDVLIRIDTTFHIDTVGHVGPTWERTFDAPHDFAPQLFVLVNTPVSASITVNGTAMDSRESSRQGETLRLFAAP